MNVNPVEKFMKELEEKTSPEEKVVAIVGFMRDSLSQKEMPRFREFWKVRELFHPSFKECANPIFKTKIWEEFSELTNEARRLKEILDEQSSFAVEQLQLALSALKSDYEANQRGSHDFSFPRGSYTLNQKKEEYESMQSEVHFLSTLATRLRELRKGIIETDMRIRFKNQLLKEVSALGDQFLPRRKELIEKLSSSFIADVKVFADKHFTPGAQRVVSLSSLREEIKAFQSAAKQVALNATAFKETRELLSKCWDQLQEEDKTERAAFEAKRGEREVAKSAQEAKRKEELRVLEEQMEKQRERENYFAKELNKKGTLESLQSLLEEMDGEGEPEKFEEMRDELYTRILEKKASSKKEGGSLWHDLDAFQAELKGRLETLRRKEGGSGLDFDRALTYRYRIESIRKLLDRVLKMMDKLA